MDCTKTHVKIYNFTPEVAEDFDFDFSTFDSGLLSQLVPNRDDWGSLAWGIELEEYEYNSHDHTAHLSLDTKWESPVEWVRNASMATHYFQNKLFIASTIQKDETHVTGVAIMDGEILQNKTIWSMEPEEVSKYYDEEENEYELDDLDNKIWDAIGKFTKVCEEFYLERKEND